MVFSWLPIRLTISVPGIGEPFEQTGNHATRVRAAIDIVADVQQ